MWNSLGQIYNVDPTHRWMKSHAQVPTPLVMEEQNLIRIYFATRPKKSQTLIAFADFDRQNLQDGPVYIHQKPILSLGKQGMFDEHGTMPSSIIKKGKKIFLFYSGWSRSTSLPYANFTGLAVSEDNGFNFQRIGQGPILDRTIWGPYSATSPHVVLHKNKWYMYYSSGLDWLNLNGKKEHTYDIKIATSDDGINWIQTGITAIGQSHSKEALTKPTIYSDGVTHHMWYCARGCDDFRGGVDGYKIKYAYSQDLIEWTKSDSSQYAIFPETQTWDNQKRAYPEIINEKDRLILFYNVNGFGSTGFGAMWYDNK